MMSLRPTIFACTGLLALAACTPVREPLPETWAKASAECPPGNEKSALAGAWLYEDQGYIDTLHLDKRGNGALEWQDGRFSTSCLNKRHWRGTWKQAESKGGFEIELSRDLTTGKGRRWHTQIDQEQQPGGSASEFQVKRIGAASQVSEPSTGHEAVGR